MRAYLNALKNYAVFNGRATRSDFWWFILILMLLLVLGLILDESMGNSIDGPVQPITGLIWLAHALPAFGIQARRLHDTGRSGWWQLIALIPFGAVVLFVFNVTASEENANAYGPSPTSNKAVKGGTTSPTVKLAPEKAVEQLEKLSTLKASGAIDEAEFQQMKSEVLARQK